MIIQITVTMDNAAFTDNPDELKQVLSQIEIRNDGFFRNLRDSNGNLVGHYRVIG